jgi:hypothetical protein
MRTKVLNLDCLTKMTKVPGVEFNKQHRWSRSRRVQQAWIAVRSAFQQGLGALEFSNTLRIAQHRQQRSQKQGSLTSSHETQTRHGQIPFVKSGKHRCSRLSAIPWHSEVSYAGIVAPMVVEICSKSTESLVCGPLPKWQCWFGAVVDYIHRLGHIARCRR